MKETTIKVSATRIKGENTDGKKYDFLEWSGATKSGLKCKFKFTRNCASRVPDKEGVYDLKLNNTDISRDLSRVYLEYWVRDFIEITVHESGAKAATPCEDF